MAGEGTLERSLATVLGCRLFIVFQTLGNISVGPNPVLKAKTEIRLSIGVALGSGQSVTL
jgi:hypothetical protein